MTLDKTLKTKESAESKYNKACITINFAFNIIESHKLKSWFIKKAGKL